LTRETADFIPPTIWPPNSQSARLQPRGLQSVARISVRYQSANKADSACHPSGVG